VSDRSGREVLEEWRGLMESAVSSAASAAGRPDLPRELLGAMQNQMALMQRVVDRERLQGSELAARVLAPLDAVFDLLEEGGATLRREAKAAAGLDRRVRKARSGTAEKRGGTDERSSGATKPRSSAAKRASGDKQASGGTRAGAAGRRKSAAAKQPSGAPAKRRRAGER